MFRTSLWPTNQIFPCCQRTYRNSRLPQFLEYSEMKNMFSKIILMIGPMMMISADAYDVGSEGT